MIEKLIASIIERFNDSSKDRKRIETGNSDWLLRKYLWTVLNAFYFLPIL